LSNQITFSESPEELIVDCFSDIEELVAKLLSRLRKLSLSLDIGSKLTSLGFPASVEFLELSDCEVESLEGFKFPVSLSVLSTKIMRSGNCKIQTLVQFTLLKLGGTNMSTLECQFPIFEYYAPGNCLISLDRVHFPESGFLDITTKSTESI